MDSTPGNLPGPDSLGIGRIQFFRDCESGGAWPFLVRGVNCLLNCDNGRDLRLVTGRPRTLPRARVGALPLVGGVSAWPPLCASRGAGRGLQVRGAGRPSQGLLLIKRRKREAITGQ